jgi:hypothetical protein
MIPAYSPEARGRSERAFSTHQGRLPRELALYEIITMDVANRHRCHYVRVRVRVHRYTDGSLAVFHGPRKLADYDAQGKLKESKKGKAA